jgi:hypothetical protein
VNSVLVLNSSPARLVNWYSSIWLDRRAQAGR